MQPTFINPKHVMGMARDEYEPEQFLPWRVPTVFRLRYRDQRWRRVYTEHRGVAYIAFGDIKALIDPITLQALYQLTPETPSYPRPIKEEENARTQEEPTQLRGDNRVRSDEPFRDTDDDIPF
jgi:hypothetical protein